MPAALSSFSMRAASGGVAGGVVAQRAQLRIEAAEVVDRLVARRAASTTGTRAAVCAETVTIAFGRPNVRVDRRAEPLHERTGLARLERDHRRAVRDEDRRQVRVHAPLDHAGRRTGFNPLARSVRDSGNVRR